MKKTYPTLEENPQVLADVSAAYGSEMNHMAPMSGISTQETLMSSTMSVDEYFDELIEKVRHDYAAL